VGPVQGRELSIAGAFTVECFEREQESRRRERARKLFKHFRAVAPAFDMLRSHAVINRQLRLASLPRQKDGERVSTMRRLVPFRRITVARAVFFSASSALEGASDGPCGWIDPTVTTGF
jgi:hypothetical protein